MIQLPFINESKPSSLIKKLMKLSLLSGLMLACTYAFAAEGRDLLEGTDADLIKTIHGTGQTYLYVAEIIIAAVGFIKTRNPTMFFGILVLSIGFNVLLKIAGV
jgi:hypothetical protein